MAGTAIEQHGSRSFKVGSTGSGATFKYFVFGESDEAAVHVLILSHAPVEWHGFYRGELDAQRRNALDQWDVTVNYVVPVFSPADPLPTGGPGNPGGGSGSPPASPPPPSGGDAVQGVDVSITTETVHVDRSVAVAQHAGSPNQGAIAGATVPANGRLIGVTNDGKIEGVDLNSVVVATLRRRVTLAPGAFTYDYLRYLIWLAGRTNETPWWIFQEEEGQFQGAEGQEKPSGQFEMTLAFGFKPSETNLALTESPEPALVVPFVRGWNYVEAFKRWETDGDIKVLRIYAYRVHRVLRIGEFSFLGI